MDPVTETIILKEYSPDALPPAAFMKWAVVLSAALFFFYEFIQLNMMGAINLAISADFHINATQVSRLSAAYFLANVILLIPAGLLLDRYSPRRLILITLTICVLATFFFGMADDLYWAAFFRFCAGIGSAFCFLATMRLASRWFCPTKMALVSGIIVTMAMLGGMVAQTPFTLLVQHLDWRDAVFIDAFLGVLIGILIWIFVKDYPPHREEEFALLKSKLSNIGFGHSLRLAYINRQNWFCGLYTGLTNLPIFILGALWGAPYLVQVLGLSATTAANVIAMLFIGTMIGCPVIGHLSDKLKKRRPFMLIGAIVSLILILMIMYSPLQHISSLMALFFLLGFFTSTQIISYPTVAESNSKAITAMSLSVISICAIGGGVVFQPIFGRLLDSHSAHTFVNGMPIYSAANYHMALWILPIGFIAAFLIALCIRETYAKAYSE